MCRTTPVATTIVACLSCLMFCAAGCSSTTPTTPSPSAVVATTTDSFSGTFGQQGSSTNPFTITTTGSVQIQLTSVAPLATMAVGVSVNSWDGTTCGAAIAQNDNARSGSTALSGTATAGSYCVKVYDSGNVPDTWSVSYTVQVTHP